jgi:hypothetical protein
LRIAAVRSSIFTRSVLRRLKRYSLAIPHGATDSDKVMDELRKTKINDAFVQDGVGTITAPQHDEGRRGIRQARRFGQLVKK